MWNTWIGQVIQQAYTRCSDTWILGITQTDNITFVTRFPCQKRQGAPADKLQVKAAKILPLVGLARSKQDPINREHGAQYLCRPPPDGSRCTPVQVIAFGK